MSPARTPAGRVLLEALPLVVVLLGVLYWALTREPAVTDEAPAPAPAPAPDLRTVTAESAETLGALFEANDYDWPPAGTVPPLALRALPHDLKAQRAPERKSLFLRTLLPLVLAENARVAGQRERLEGWMAADEPLSEAGARAARRLLERYDIEGELDDPAVRRQVRQRVDTVAPALALAQAAIESGWGTSRFARQGNNLFGEWTWDASQGLKPRRRAEDATHFVRRFPDLRASVRGYLHNLNTHDAYRELRERRRRARLDQQDPPARSLAGGLASYSERGEVYVEEVRTLIRQNRLTAAVARATLAPPGSDGARLTAQRQQDAQSVLTNTRELRR